MIVPRQYARSPPRKSRTTEVSEKNTYRVTRSPSNSPRPASPLAASLLRSLDDPSTKSEAPKKAVVRRSQPTEQHVPSRPQSTPIASTEIPRFRRESAKDLLSSTAIPIRRKPRGRPSQRLPKCDYVADFSKLLMDDLKPSSGVNLSRSISNSNFDGLFGNMDELLEDGQMFVGSEGLDSGILSTRSMSEDSFTSMASPDDYNASDRNSQHSSVSPSIPDRKLRQAAASEDCSDDHPLSLPNDDDDLFMDSPDMPSLPLTPTNKLPGRSEKKARSPLSLKSSLTASLKALKSAAQSVSTRSVSNPPNNTANTQARSYFDFQPALTDDRRPPPSFESPTPELRRYLNPPPLDSAAQLHFWQDHRHSKLNPPPTKKPTKRQPKGKKPPFVIDRNNFPTRDLPPIVQLADCLPPSVRTEHASSPPIWLTRDGTPVNKNTSIPLLFDPDANNGKGEPAARHREPRENRDFLRVFVCEMAMRRNGKLSDDLSVGRARLWLPPVNVDAAVKSKGSNAAVPGTGAGPATDKLETPVSNAGVAPRRRTKQGSERMMCLNINDV